MKSTRRQEQTTSTPHTTTPLLHTPAKHTRIGIMGTGQGAVLLMERLLSRREISGVGPASLTGIHCSAPEKDPNCTRMMELANEFGIPLFNSPKELLQSLASEVAAASDTTASFGLLADFSPPASSTTNSLCSDLPAGISYIYGPATGMLLTPPARDGSAYHFHSVVTTIIDELHEDVLLLDLSGRIVDLNRSVYADTGLTKEDFIGTECGELGGEGYCCSPNLDTCPYRNTLSTGAKAEALHTVVDEDGRLRYYRIYTYPVYGHSGTMTHILQMRRDITNRTNMEVRLQQSEKMAVIGELSTYIAHEIRNPLFAIGGFANGLLRSKKITGGEREKVSIILEESKRLDKILKSTLNFARPIEAREGEIDVSKVVADTMELMGIGCETKGITLNIDCPDRVRTDAPDASPVMLPRGQGDPELIKQCLINLVKNSQEAMPDGGVLHVRTGLDNNRVFLEVEDNGSGIPEELRKKVFNPFFSTKDKGAGLGLAMTKKIIEDMGGYVELSSHMDKGTIVRLSLLPVLAVENE